MSSQISVEAVPVRSITSLAPNSPVYVKQVVASPVVVEQPVKVAVIETDTYSVNSGSSSSSSKWWVIFIVFLIVTIISFFLLYALNPTSVQNVNAAGNPDGTVNVGKCVAGAIIIGLIFAILFWAFAASQRFC
jgi:uncharacterized integral membrane protein